MTSDLLRPSTVAEIPLVVAPFEFAPHNCFACGTLNTGGLGLTIHVEPGRSWIETSLDRRFEGWEGMAHGGILCTILDEVMAWALVGADSWGVTARMAVDFRRPVPIGRPIRAEGWITEGRRRVKDTAGRIVDAETGTLLAQSTGRYVAASESRKRELRQAYGVRSLAEGADEAQPDDPDTATTTAADPSTPERVDVVASQR